MCGEQPSMGNSASKPVKRASMSGRSQWQEVEIGYVPGSRGVDQISVLRIMGVKFLTVSKGR